MSGNLEFVERNGVSLIRHQADFGDAFRKKMQANNGTGCFTGIVGPGGGKTLAGSYCLSLAMQAFEIDTCVVVAPTTIIRQSWPKDASLFGVRLSTDVNNRRIIQQKIAGELDGFAVTYQAVASFPELYRKLTHDNNVCVSFDEIHHLSDNQAWGDAAKFAFEHAKIVISLSGTPFRTDANNIPFLEYRYD